MMTSNNILKHWAPIVTMFCASLSWGQAIIAGTGLTSGAQLVSSGGAPQMYSARADNCEVGTESGCVAQGGSGQPMSFLYTVVNTPSAGTPFAQAAPANTDATDPDFGSHLVLATDTSTRNSNTLFNLTSSGAWVAFNTNSTMLLTATGGGSMMVFYMNPSAIRGSTPCSSLAHTPSTACTYQSQIGALGASDSCNLSVGTNCKVASGTLTFSSHNPYILYELAASNTKVSALQICDVNGLSPYCSVTASDTFKRTVYKDFVADGILQPTYQAAWNGTFAMSADDSFSLALAGGADWIPATYYLAGTPGTTVNAQYPGLVYGTGDWTSDIQPAASTNNRNHGYFAVTAGYTSATSSGEPTWSATSATSLPYICEQSSTAYATAQTCPSTCGSGSNQQCVQWMDIGVENNQNSGYDLVDYTVGVGDSAINTYIGQVRRDASAYAHWSNGEQPWASGHPAPGDTSTGYWLTDNPVLCAAYTGVPPIAGTTNYSPPCPFGDTPYSLHGDHSVPNSQYANYSTGDTNGYPNGTAMGATQLYAGLWNNATAYVKNAIVYYLNSASSMGWSFYQTNGAAVSAGGSPPGGSNTNWSLTGEHGNGNVWYVPSLIQRTCTQSQCSGHDEEGYTSKWSGTYYEQALLGSPSTYTVNTPYINDLFDPGTKTVPVPFTGDTHESPNAIGVGDAGIITFFVNTVPFTRSGALAPYNQEIVGAATGLGTVPAGTLYRFGNSFNTGSSYSFQTQNGIGVASQDGQWVAFPTDLMGTRGSTSQDWVASASHTWGDYIYPQKDNCNNTGSGGATCTSFSPAGFDYQVTAVGGNSSPTPGSSAATGTTGSSEPNWDVTCTTICLDPPTCSGAACATQLTWTRQPYACNRLRGDVSDVVKGAVVSAGTCIYPNSETTGKTIYCATAGGTAANPRPTWIGSGAVCPNYGPCPSGIDGTVQWFNEGGNDCRSDIMLVDLMSAH